MLVALLLRQRQGVVSSESDCIQCLLSGCQDEAAASLQSIVENSLSQILVEHFVSHPYPIEDQGFNIRIRRPGEPDQGSSVISESLGVLAVR